MREKAKLLVARWFDGLNNSDLGGLLSLFSPSPKIRNAANPPLEGPRAPQQLLTDFFERTTARRFSVVDMAEADRQVFAHWVGELTFAAGACVAGVRLAAPVTVQLRGVERFHFNADDRIAELDIIHETTTVALAARAAAKQEEV
jgi:SnoaL-like domain